jgi:hypothetical protein
MRASAPAPFGAGAHALVCRIQPRSMSFCAAGSASQRPPRGYAYPKHRENGRARRQAAANADLPMHAHQERCSRPPVGRQHANFPRNRCAMHAAAPLQRGVSASRSSGMATASPASGARLQPPPGVPVGGRRPSRGQPRPARWRCGADNSPASSRQHGAGAEVTWGRGHSRRPRGECRGGDEVPEVLEWTWPSRLDGLEEHRTAQANSAACEIGVSTSRRRFLRIRVPVRIAAFSPSRADACEGTHSTPAALPLQLSERAPISRSIAQAVGPPINGSGPTTAPVTEEGSIYG